MRRYKGQHYRNLDSFRYPCNAAIASLATVPANLHQRLHNAYNSLLDPQAMSNAQHAMATVPHSGLASEVMQCRQYWSREAK